MAGGQQTRWRGVGGRPHGAFAPEGKARIKFDTGDHPRDRLGKWVEVGGTVAIRGGGQATVLESVGGGRVRVRRDDGQEVVLDAGLTTQIRSAEQNQANAGGPQDLAAELADNPDATPPPGQRADDAPEADPAVAAARPVGGQPAPDADPAGALSYLATPSGDQVAWLRDDEGEEPVGYLRTDAGDPATTLRFEDGATWARQIDGVGMEPTETVPVGPGDVDDTPDPVRPAEREDSDTPAAASAASRVDRSASTASPETMRLFLEEGLGEVGTFRGDSAGVGQGAERPDREVLISTTAAASSAKVEAITNVTARMDALPDEDMLTAGDLAVLGQIRSGDAVRLRMPGAEDRMVDPAQWEKLRTTQGDVVAARGIAVVAEDQFRTERRQARVSDAVAMWATTSNGLNPRALAMQDAAVEVFGMTEHVDWPAFEDYPELREDTARVLEEDRPFLHAFLLAQYEATQERFAEQGITEVQVFRGHRAYLGTPEWAGDDTSSAVPLRPLSSFSTDEHLAASFARTTDTDEGYLVSTVVPVERILGTPRSGFGALSEAEIVVLAGPGEFAVRPVGDQDGPRMDVYWDPLDFGGGDDEFFEDDEEEFDPTTGAPSSLANRDELLAAIAAAGDDARRRDLMARAEVMGLASLIPEAWGANGQIVTPAGGDLADPGGGPALDDTQFLAHAAAVEDAIGTAMAYSLDSASVHSLDGAGEVWAPDRAEQHNEIVDQVWATAANVANDGRAVFVVGPIGADKTAALDADGSGVDAADYLTISTDDLKAIMAARGMAPEIPDSAVQLSPMERSLLLHEEATHLANLIGARAAADRKNVLWDASMALTDSVTARMEALRADGYGEVRGVYVDVPIEVAVARASADYRAELEAFRAGQGQGGRYVPESTIRADAASRFHSANRANFEAVRDSFDDWQVWNDHVDGAPPALAYYRGAPNLDRLTEAAATGTAVLDVKRMPGTRAALAAALRREGLAGSPTMKGHR